MSMIVYVYQCTRRRMRMCVYLFVYIHAYMFVGPHTYVCMYVSIHPDGWQGA